ncbi:two component transcriptional regulator, LytTR family [Roseateles sp. YR242]|uniref:LytR/AlgR family response regulator transcription factor n=1 Tax=Roseateles sp. YR242 TaxID=1855305 RepID=UPI0008D55571|nr:LytTR family DNA-binding domain-containing protein [Roseateles sp. YR242]SEL29923.1 two component transcriptional regulator, LytTR family [Roseateles sp. YR242]
MKLSTLIADDEEGPREQLRAALSRLAPGLEIVAQCANGVDAWDDCLALEPQLCFLDIRMPGLSGLEVAQRMAQLAEPPQVVFVTAYGDHALSAFDAGAVDYLLKPVEDHRLEQCLQRLPTRLNPAQTPSGQGLPPSAQPGPQAALPAATLELLRQLLPAHRPAMRPIQASQGREVQLIAPEDVLFFQSDSRYTRVVHRDGEAWIRTALKELLADLDPQLFWQVHRSVVVNSRFITTATRLDENTMQLSLRGHTEKLPVSRQFQGLFKGQ